jgi:protein phosphatase
MVKFAVKSHTGLVREKNEDSYSIVTDKSGTPVVLVIADGMGGHNSGEIASKMAVDHISSHILDMPSNPSLEDSILEFISGLMEEANARIYSLSSQKGANYGMGTTLITAAAFENKLFIGHAGDSRVYLIRNGRIERITTDHSLVEELVKTGSLSRSEANNHPKKNIITRAVGCTESIQIDTYKCDIYDNDIFILCTDGLTNMLSEEEIMEVAESAASLETACEELVDRANKNGGEDNITVIMLENKKAI